MKIIEKIFSGITAIQLLYLFMVMISGTLPTSFEYTITFSESYFYTISLTLSQLLIGIAVMIGIAMILGVSVVGSGFNSESIRAFLKGMGFIMFVFILNFITLSVLDSVAYVGSTLKTFVYIIQTLFFLTKLTDS